MAEEARRKIFTYLLLVFALSAFFYWQILAVGKGKLHMLPVLGLMWCPGVAAIITRLIYQRNLRGMGWGWGKTRYQAASYLVPLVGGLLVYGLVWLTGLGGFSPQALSKQLPLPAMIGVLSTLGFLSGSFFALGEEIGWRGLLVPELAKVTSFGWTTLISGGTWVLFHYPLILFGEYHSSAPRWWSLLFFTLGIVAASVGFAWMRLKSGSLWTAVILHASHNLFLQEIFDPLTVNRGKTQYITTEFGVGMALFYGLVAWYCWRRRGDLPVAVEKEPAAEEVQVAPVSTGAVRG
ncbi:MAG: CPBP family intramembrane glutamic endopeptidase [Thermoanaerobaculia bacterium]